MIELYYRSLKYILGEQSLQKNARMTAMERQQIRAYRQKKLNLHAADLEITKAPQGKPIAKNFPEFEFNHSHSQQYYVLSCSQDVSDLGVDLEDLSRQVKMQALAERSFHPEEYHMWKSLNDCRTYWFKVWTIKEAVLKAHGLGIRLELKSLNTQAHPTWDFGRVEHSDLGVFMYQCLHLNQSILTVAYRQKDMQLQTLCLK